MLDGYMKKIESIIEKEEFDRSNYEEKILEREEMLKSLDNDKLEQEKENELSEVKLKQKISQKKSNNDLSNRPAWNSNTLKNKINKQRETLKQSKVITSKNIKNKVEEKKKKNLNFQKQQEDVNRKHNQLTEEISKKENEIKKFAKEKEDLSKFLFKMEKVVKGKTNKSPGGETTVMTFTNEDSKDDRNNFEAFDSQRLTINISGGSPNIILNDDKGQNEIILSKKDLMRYLNKTYRENQGLKNFQNQIFNLSKAYDDINNNLADCISEFQQLCTSTKGDEIKKEDVNTQLDNLKKYIDISLETKQNEYNILMDKVDEDINFLKTEFLEYEKEMKEGDGMERIEMQRKIMELQNKKEELERQIQEIESKKENDQNVA